MSHAVWWPTRRQVNLLLLVLCWAGLVTGTWLFGTEGQLARPLALVHGVIGVGVVVLSPRKRRTVAGGLARARRSRWLSLVLLGSVVATVITGFGHSLGWRDVLGCPVMHVHVIAAITAGVLVTWHAAARPSRPVRADASRRAVLRAGVVGGVAGLGWLAVDRTARVLDLPGAARRGTGSHELASGDPSRMPGTIWFTDRVPDLDPATHRVRLPEGAVGVDALVRGGATWTATLDCTTGWYSVQEWSGSVVADLLGPPPPGAGCLEVVSVTGYRRRFPLPEAADLLLATHLGGEPLRARHGAPVRLVARGRRGFWWVKWVAEVCWDPGPEWAQPPFPLT